MDYLNLCEREHRHQGVSLIAMYSTSTVAYCNGPSYEQRIFQHHHDSYMDAPLSPFIADDAVLGARLLEINLSVPDSL